jgi:hypothetical protein
MLVKLSDLNNCELGQGIEIGKSSFICIFSLTCRNPLQGPLTEFALVSALQGRRKRNTGRIHSSPFYSFLMNFARGRSVSVNTAGLSQNTPVSLLSDILSSMLRRKKEWDFSKKPQWNIFVCYVLRSIYKFHPRRLLFIWCFKWEIADTTIWEGCALEHKGKHIATEFRPLS